METPIYKCDLIVPVKVITPSMSLSDFLTKIVKQGLTEVKIEFDEQEVERLVKENNFIKFMAYGVPFTFMLSDE